MLFLFVSGKDAANSLGTAFYDHPFFFFFFMVSETFLRASQCKEANIEHQSSFITILLNKESPLLIIVIFLSSASGHNISLGQEAGGLSGFAVGINQSIRSARLQG
jgi:hypothetical protein